MKIAVANLKGGTGKTTIAQIIAQIGGLRYVNKDEYQSPEKYAVAETRGDRGEVHDFGGYAVEEIFSTDYDLVVVPFQPTMLSIPPTALFLKKLFDAKVRRVALVANMARDEKIAERATEMLAEAIEEHIPETADIYVTSLKRYATLEAAQWEGLDISSLKKSWNPSRRRAYTDLERIATEIIQIAKKEIK